MRGPAAAPSRLHPATLLAALGTLAFLYLPLLAVAAYSVNASRHGLVWRGFTLDWYRRLFADPHLFELARNTLVLALASTAVATVLGTALALGLERFPGSRRALRALEAVLALPVVTPDILLAVAMVVALGVLRQLSPLFAPGLLAMVLAHVTFQIAFVAIPVRARLAALGPAVEEAARDLYASGWFLFRRVTLPLLAPGIAAGALLAFTLSLDDFVVSFFTAGPTSTTLPLYIYASVRRGVTPEIHALSTLVVAATVALVLAGERLTRRPAAALVPAGEGTGAG